MTYVSLWDSVDLLGVRRPGEAVDGAGQGGQGGPQHPRPEHAAAGEHFTPGL
jgi:hypothetical protein